MLGALDLEEAELSVLLVDDEGIRVLNRECRACRGCSGTW
jgi:ssRNA-specific RNase YbeY (16S rRNA maturation enzyme)